jgi:hypothetical protein
VRERGNGNHSINELQSPTPAPIVSVSLYGMAMIMILLVAMLLVDRVCRCDGFYSPKHITSLQRQKHRFYLSVVDATVTLIGEEPLSNNRKHPNFPGAAPIQPTDAQTFKHQTNQASPAAALLGKPASCLCAHGFPQAFSLDPIPISTNRLNSGLLKLTCPLLVNAIDCLEDDGFIDEINGVVQNEVSTGDGGALLAKCMHEAHLVHSGSRQRLLESSSAASEKSPHEIIENKLGKEGAEHFLAAGVAGANPLAEKADVKCIHAWLADYMFRKAVADSTEVSAGMTKDHPIGELIKDALSKRGIDMHGTDNCHLVCSGLNSHATSKVGQIVTVPTPRNKQRKRKMKCTERRRRIRHGNRIQENE